MKNVLSEMEWVTVPRTRTCLPSPHDGAPSRNWRIVISGGPDASSGEAPEGFAAKLSCAPARQRIAMSAGSNCTHRRPAELFFAAILAVLLAIIIWLHTTQFVKFIEIPLVSQTPGFATCCR